MLVNSLPLWVLHVFHLIGMCLHVNMLLNLHAVTEYDLSESLTQLEEMLYPPDSSRTNNTQSLKLMV